MIFALVSSIVTIIVILFNYVFPLKTNKSINDIKRLDVIRIIYTGIAVLTFTLFIGMSAKLGGSAAEDSYASWRYEYYELGKYYLSSHGNFTLVTYDNWYMMKVLEQSTVPLILLAIIWNFLYVAKTKGIKYILTHKSSDINEIGSSSSTSTKVGFILLSIFVFSIAILIMISVY